MSTPDEALAEVLKGTPIGSGGMVSCVAWSGHITSGLSQRGYAIVRSDELAGLRAVANAADAYSPRFDHDWRCEYRTKALGWKPGDPPVIQCECGYDRLRSALEGVSR